MSNSAARPSSSPKPSLGTPPLTGTGWQKTIWRGESAWASAQGSVLAVVSEVRQRLIYLGSPDGAVNLLNAPYPQTLPNEQNRWPNQGGHRFWLGPQKDWVWPPLTEWEYSAASHADSTGEILTLRQLHLDRSYPAITREYAWSDDQLRCTARWPDNGRAYFGMHVVPVDLPFSGGAQLVRTDEVPLGLVHVQMDGAETDGFLPHPAVTLDAAHATLRGGQSVIKLGFAIQPLTISRSGGWQLSVLPGPHQGVAVSAPDKGYLSQIWVGGPAHDIAELEQLSLFLRGDSSGHCASTIFLDALPPARR